VNDVPRHDMHGTNVRISCQSNTIRHQARYEGHVLGGEGVRAIDDARKSL
jgi:hypothetical protein